MEPRFPKATLEGLLVAEARKRGVIAISPDATAMGMPLYESMGLVHMPMEMELPNT